MPDGYAPVKPHSVGNAGEQPSRLRRRRVRTRPQHPRGEDAVEQRLHQRRAEEAPALFALEPDTERFLKCRPHGGELRRVTRRLDAGKAVARVRGKQPRQIPRLRQRRAVRQRPCEVLAKARAGVAGERARLLQTTEELVLVAGEPKGFEGRGLAVCVLAQQHEVAGVCHEHEPVPTPVTAGLGARSREPCVICRGFHLDHAALWRLPFARRTLLYLFGRVEAEVGMARALVGQFLNAEHFGTDRRADCRQEIAERSIQRPLLGRAPGGPDSAQVGEVLFDRRRQLRGRSAHLPSDA